MPLVCNTFVEDSEHSSIISFDPNAHDFEFTLGVATTGLSMRMSFFTDSAYTTEITAYPHEVIVGDVLYVEIDATLETGFTMMLDRCVATERQESALNWQEFYKSLNFE